MVLGYASLAEEFTIRGLALGEGPVRAFESRLERGFLRVSEFLMAKQGACHRFEARGKSPVAGPDAELPVPVEDPFEQDAQPCRVDRDAARAHRGARAAPRPPRTRAGARSRCGCATWTSPTSSRCSRRSARAASSSTATSSGRVSVEVTRATLDETLAAIRKAAGVEIAASGTRAARLQRRGSPPRSDAPEGGPPASFALKRAEVRDVLAAMADVDPQLAALGPPGFLGRVSVWTRDAPLGAVRAAVLDSAGLGERTEEERRVVERPHGRRARRRCRWRAPAPSRGWRCGARS